MEWQRRKDLKGVLDQAKKESVQLSLEFEKTNLGLSLKGDSDSTFNSFVLASEYGRGRKMYSQNSTLIIVFLTEWVLGM